MVKALKILGLLAGIVAGLAVAAAVLIPLLVDPNDFRQEIAGAVERSTGRKLEIEGKIGLSVFPWLGVELGAARLGNAPGFGSAPFASIQSAQVRVRLLPLLHKELQADTITLRGLVLNLARRADGATNWDDLMRPRRDSGHPDGVGLAALAVGGVEMTGARLTWADARSGSRYTADHLSLETGALTPGRPFPVTVSLDAKGAPPNVAGHVTLSGQVSIDPQGSRAQIRGARLGVQIPEPGASLKQVQGELSTDLDFDGASRHLRLDGARLRLSASGSEHGLRSVSATARASVSLDLNTLALAVRGLKADYDLNTGAADVHAAGSLQGEIDADLTTRSARLTHARLETLAESTGLGLKSAGAVVTGEVMLAGDLLRTRDLHAVATMQAQDGSSGLGSGSADLKGDLRYDVARNELAAQTLEVQVQAGLPGTAVQARARLTTGLLFHGAGSRLDAQRLALKVHLTGQGVPGSQADFSLDGDLTADLRADTLRVDQLRLNVLDLIQATGEVTASGLAGQPQVDGSLAFAELSPRALLQRLGQPVPNLADPRALTKARLRATFGATATSADLQRLELVLDDSTLTGSFNFRDFRVPAVSFRLDVDALDLDRYAAVAAGAGPTGSPRPVAGAPAQGSVIPAALPLETVRRLDLDGTAHITRLKLDNLRTRDVRLSVKAKDGIVRIDPLSAGLYQGRLDTRLSVDARGKSARVAVNSRLSDVDIGLLLRDLQGQEKLTGTARVAADLTAQGVTSEELTKTLNGSLDLAAINGAIKGINVPQLIRDAKARLRGEGAVAPNSPRQTDFSDLHASGTITNGVLRSDDLQARSPLLRVLGQGALDLVHQQIDYRVKAVIVETSTGQGGKDLQDLRGLPIPVHITGSFADPQYVVDLGDILQNTVKRQVQKQIEKKLQDKLGDQLQQQLLKGLFGR